MYSVVCFVYVIHPRFFFFHFYIVLSSPPATRRRAGDAAGALGVLRGMSKTGITPGEHAIASTMEAFARVGDVNQVMSLMKVNVLQ